MGIQKRLKPTKLDWDKIYINNINKKVFIFRDKEKKDLDRIMPLQEFEKWMRLVPHINYIILTMIL